MNPTIKLFVSLLVSCSAALGAQRALLVGLSEYKLGSRLHLDGPAQDVQAFRQRLVTRLGFPAANVRVLLNGDATRTAILDALDKMVGETQAGDFLVFYFTGHGTSSFDKGLPNMGPGLGPNTGALVPYDVRLDSAPAILESLLVGRRDLRPILGRLHPQARALVLLDACYSGETTKATGVPDSLKARFIPLDEDPPDAPARKLPTLAGVEAAMLGQPNAADPYPYSNVISISAASKFEPALDISDAEVLTGRHSTVDGRAHGAFTNSFLSAVDGSADANADGTVTFQELYDFVRVDVERQFPQKPQMLTPQTTLARSAAFRMPGSAPAAIPPAPASQAEAPLPAVRVELQRIPPDLESRLANVAGVRIVPSGADLILRGERGGEYGLFHRNLHFIRTYTKDEIPELIQNLESRPQALQIVEWKFAKPAMATRLEVLPAGQGVFWDGQRLRIQASTERPAYLLIFNVDSTGRFTVLYPTQGAGMSVANQAVEIGAGVVGAPYGVDEVKLFAFPAPPPGYDSFRCERQGGGTSCPEFSSKDPLFTSLIALLKGATPGSGETKYQIVTKP